MSCTINREEALELSRILQQANKTYLKESRLNAQSNFNILRVLSAFRLLHPDSPTSLYNSIIYITKIYNPQNLEEWQQAIKNLSKPTAPTNKSRNNRTQTSVYMKTYQNSFNKDRINSSHFQSKSYAQIKIPPQGSFSQEASFDQPTNKDISQTNAETGKRYFLTKADSLIDNSKNHYISFEPYHHISGIYPHSYYQKENINSTNIGESRKGESALQYIEAIRRDIGSYSLNKTPVDQSFIKKIDSYESPYLISQANLEPIDPQEEAMNERAQEYLKISLKFKAFSSLVANTLAFQKAKEYRLKADMLNRAVLLQRSFICLRENAQFEKTIRERQRQAQNHYIGKQKKNIMNVFKLLFSLRTKKTSVNPNQFNVVSYDFILTLLFSIQQHQETSQGRLVDFDSKINQFINTHEIDKVYLIIKYFGRHTWMTQQAVQRLVEQYKKSITKRTFSILMSQRQQNKKYMSIREKHLQRDSFQALKQKWWKSRQNKMKVMEAEGKRNKTLQSKVMKGLLEIVYSVKLYSKRCQYLQKKYDSKVKSTMLTLWQEATKSKIARFKALQERVKSSQRPLIDFFKTYYFRQLRLKIDELLSKQQTLSAFLFQRRIANLLSSLKQRRERQGEQAEIERKIKQVCFMTALSKWKDSTRKGKALNRLFKIIKQIFFRALVAPALQNSIVQFKIVEQSELTLKRNVLTALKDYCSDKARQYQQLTARASSMLVQSDSKMFLKLLEINRSQQQRLRFQKQINSKKSTIEESLRNSQYLRLFKMMRQVKSDHLQNQQSKSKLTDLKMHSYIKDFIKKAKAMQDFQSKFKELIKNQYTHKTSSALKAIRQQILDMKVSKIQETRKRKAVRSINQQAIIIFQQQKSIIDDANHHYQRQIAAKTIKIIRMMVETRKKVEDYIKEGRKIKVAQTCGQKLRWFHQQVRAKKSYHRYQKSLFLNKLKEWKRRNQNELDLNRLLIDLKANQFLSSLKAFSHSKQSCKANETKVSYLAKWIAINRLKQSYINSLISKKYQYMAVKFRALKICQKIFTAWQRKNPKTTTYKLKSEVVNLRKGNERLSTDFA